MSLFVGDEDDNMQVDASPEVSQEYEISVKNEPINANGSSTNNNNTMDEEEEDDDPIVQSFPLILNHLPNTATQSLHVLQYPGRPKTLPYPESSIRPYIKEESSFLELKVPLDTLKFFDQGRLEEWGLTEQVEEHGLQGVLNKTDGGSYIGYVTGEADEDRKFIILPVDRTTQLRPSFKYLDDLELAKQAQRRSDYIDTQKTQATIQVLQTSSAKSAAAQGNTGEGFLNNAMGESLRCIKKFEEEDWKQLEYKEGEDKEVILQQILDNLDQKVLKTDTTMSEYIELLTNI